MACDNRDEFYKELNSDPQISVMGSDEGVYTDSVKISQKSPRPYKELDITFGDIDKNIEKFTIDQHSGNTVIIIDNKEYSERSAVIDEEYIPFNVLEYIDIRFEPLEVGQNCIQLAIADELDKHSAVTINLIGFINIAPVAKIDHHHVGVNSPYEYTIDAGNSYDGDQKYGGAISRYRYRVNGQEIISEEDQINYIFPEPGNYTLRLSVRDNDGEWSEEAEEILTVD